MREIIRQCMALSADERAALAKILADSLDDARKHNAAERYKTLLIAATSLLGRGIDTKCRDTNCCIGRMLIAYKMRQEGFSLTQIGIVMGRDHATILHYQRKMEDVLHFRFKMELAYWEEFNTILNDGIH